MRSKETLYKSIIKDYENQNLLIGKTLHENIAQDLYAIRLTLQRYSIEQGHEIPIDQVKKILEGTIEKVQQIANDLLPVVLRDFGIQRAIKDLFVYYNGIKNNIIIDKNVNNLDFNDQLSLYQLIQLLVKATVLPDDNSMLVCKLFVNQDKLLLIMQGLSKYYIKEFNNYNQENIKKLQERVNLLEGTLDINTNPQNSEVVVIVKLD